MASRRSAAARVVRMAKSVQPAEVRNTAASNQVPPICSGPLDLRHADTGVVLGDDRVVLAGLAAQKALEVVEAQAVGPAVERPGRPLLVIGREVPLAEGRGRVAVALEDLADASGTLGPGGVVARP